MSEQRAPFAVTDRRHSARDEPPAEVQTAPAGSPAEEAGAPALPVDLAGLLVWFGAQAAALLGLGGAGPDLGAARQAITLIEVLGEKTRGNRTAEEEAVLEDLLYQLRMAYVETVRGGSPMPPQEA